MSRCFPFPPPGYEKKARLDDIDLLKKEKQKEKKHKKEKKDKEKREGKEKKEKDRSDGKHRDKKERKEKHRDKKKEDRSSNSDKKKLPVHSEGQNREKTSDEKKLPGKSEGHSGEKSIQKEARDNDRSCISGEKKLAGKISGYNGEKLVQNSHLAEDSRDSKFVHELGRRVRDEDRGVGNQLVKKSIGTEEGVVRLVAKTVSPLAEGKDKSKRSDERNLDGQGVVEETRLCGNDLVHNFVGAVSARVEGMPRQVEKVEKSKDKECVDKLSNKHKDRSRQKKSHGKDKDRDKEKKKEEKVKEKGEHKNLEQDNLKDSRKVDPLVTVDLIPLQSSKERNKTAVAEENLRKRKDFEKNGFIHVNDIKPNKLPRPASSHPFTDNGMVESFQTPIPFTSDGQGTASGLKMDSKERKVNGVIEAQMHSVSPIKPASASAQAGRIDEVSKKPPHPDSKYLSQVLTVPKMEEWSDFDDQEWLFGSTESQSKSTKVESSEIDEAPQVWADALLIESADVYALPYVIPY